MKQQTLSQAALAVLTTADPHEKALLTHIYMVAWRSGEICKIGEAVMPDRPARHDQIHEAAG